MKVLKAGLLILFLFGLAACGKVTSGRDLGGGVDENGAYVILGVDDTDAALAPTAAFTPVGRRVELRGYSGGRYGAWLIVSSGKNHVSAAGTLGLSFSRDDPAQNAAPGKRFDLYMEKDKTWNGNTGAVAPPFQPDRVCARIVYERFASNDQAGGSDRMDGGVSYVCVRP